MNGPIIVGTDGSARARQAVDAAIEMAVAFGADLVIVEAYQPTTRLPKDLPAELADVVTPMSSIEHTLDEALANAQEAGARATVRSIAGDPADVLLGVAEELDAAVIVVGNKGIGSLKRFVLGNVPSKVVHHAPCSIFIVHTT
jgi:nucleotide-binding universal stress UspA family protein